MKNGVPSLPRTDRKNKGRVGIDLTLYDAVALKDEVALEVAVSVLEDTLEFNSVSIDQLVEDLTSIPHLFEFMLSAMNESTFVKLRTSILNDFPSTAENFAGCSALKLLRQFSAYLFFISYPPLTEPPNVKDRRRAVDLAVPALKELSSISFTEISSRKKRSTKRASMNIAVDRKPFEALGVDTPCTKEEADRLVAKVLEDQKGVLQYYFEIFRMSDLAETFKYAYIPRFPVRESQSVSEAPHTSGHDMRTAYPMVQPMKAAQYFDNVANFGQWRILVSDRANRFLRQTRKRERKLFDIIIKKIGELSNGHFSSDNQKKVAGFDTAAVPIFEAKMSRDARLIYQVDCVMDFDNVFRQAIRIYGVYTHTQLSRLSSFWETLGRELGKRGGLYRERCLRRLSLATDDNVFLPESFPVRNTIDVDTSPTALTMLTDNDDFELGELLVLHKYVTLSQALLNSILNDQDSAYLFDMSSQEKIIIEHPTSCYVIGRSGTGKTTTMMYKMLGIHRAWETYHGSMPKPWQLFVTQSRVLANKVQGYFFQLQTSTAGKQDTAYATEQSQQAQIMYDQDEEFLQQNLLPRRFGELKDEHFPMFITFDHLCYLLEAELDSASGNVSEYVENSDNIDYMQQNRVSFVSLNVFVNSYWRHFPEQLRKGLDPTLVFGEFMGVIKGSERALEYEDKYLDQSTYLGFSNRSQGTFVGQRENIYALFQAYLMRKRERREYDAADRTHRILTKLQSGSTPGQLVDFLYVDEAQDNLLIDALILRSLCRNPDGLFWAGDTAQTISAGSSFKFNELKAFLHRTETRRGVSKHSSQTPETFHLAVNYRSHMQIVDCAQTVIELIAKLWPHSIDQLNSERGLARGPKPVFFIGNDSDTDALNLRQLLQGLQSEPQGKLELGADQCILVRNDTTKRWLYSLFGDEVGMIMTLYECKGLEFNDVFLYNFFKDSTVDHAQWRVVFNILHNDISAFLLDQIRDSSVCRELKFLYVAITRARTNLFLTDCSERAEPMRDIWTMREQVRIWAPGDYMPRLAMGSSLSAWAERAHNLFDNKKYEAAMHAFERARLPHEKHIAESYHLRDLARSTNLTNDYLDAAEKFMESAKYATLVSNRRKYLRIAGGCFADAKAYGESANAYAEAEEFILSGHQYLKLQKFKEAFDVVNSNRNTLTKTEADTFVEPIRLHYFRNEPVDDALKLFSTDEDAISFMKHHDLYPCLIAFLEKLGRYSDAAGVHLERGNVLPAIRLCFKNSSDGRSIRCGEQHLLKELWMKLTFGVKPGSKSWGTYLIQLLDAAKERPLSDVSFRQPDDIDDQIMMFLAIERGDADKLLKLGYRFLLRKDISSAILSLDNAFDNWNELEMNSASDAEIIEILQAFQAYAHLLKGWITKPPCADPPLRRLFGIRGSNKTGRVLLTKGTFLDQAASCDMWQTVSETDDGRFVHGTVLTGLLRSALGDHLEKRIKDENRMCQALPVFSRCVSCALSGQCYRGECPREHEHGDQPMESEALHSRMRICFQQLSIHDLNSADGRTMQTERRVWLGELCHTIWPPFFQLGTTFMFNPALVPDFLKGRQVARLWIRDLIHGFSLYDSSGPLLITIHEIVTLSFMLECLGADADIKPARVKSQEFKEHEKCLSGESSSFSPHDQASGVIPAVQYFLSVVKRNLRIDMNVLCHLFEYLCGSFILCFRNHRPSPLHNIVLPHAWLNSLCAWKLNLGMTRNWEALDLFVKSVPDLLKQILDGSRGAHAIDLDLQIRRILRFFRGLILLGQNIVQRHFPNTDRNEFDLHSVILQILTSLPQQINNGIIHSFPLSEYINAKEWRHLLRALWRTDQTTAELIHLQDEVRIKVDAVMIPGNLRSIKFETLDKLPSLLAFTPPRASRRTPAPFPTEWMPPKELLPPTTQTSVDSQVSGGIAEAAPVNGESPREVSAGQQQSVADEGQLDLALMDVQTSVSAQSKEEAMEDKIVAVIESAAAGQQNVAIEG